MAASIDMEFVLLLDRRGSRSIRHHTLLQYQHRIQCQQLGGIFYPSIFLQIQKSYRLYPRPFISSANIQKTAFLIFALKEKMTTCVRSCCSYSCRILYNKSMMLNVQPDKYFSKAIFLLIFFPFFWNHKCLPGSGACVVATVGCVVSVNIYIFHDIRESGQGQPLLQIYFRVLMNI